MIILPDFDYFGHLLLLMYTVLLNRKIPFEKVGSSYFSWTGLLSKSVILSVHLIVYSQYKFTTIDGAKQQPAMFNIGLSRLSICLISIFKEIFETIIILY